MKTSMTGRWWEILVATILFGVATARAQSNATITIQVDQPGAAVSSNLFGIFFEEINFGGDGGLYGQMIRNRSFAGSASTEFWTLVTTGTAAGQMSTDTFSPPNTNLVRSLKLTKTSGTGSVGAANAGYFVGMAIQSNATYDLSFYARGTNGFAANLGARLENSTGSLVYTQVWVSGVTTNWQKFTASLVPSVTDTNARVVLSITNNSTVWLNVVSLFPRATFHSRTNGMRADVANMLADLKPSFLRYPGGNFIEGNSLSTSVRWKKTIGDIATRRGHTNDAWGYWSTDGFGLHEFLLLCEDLGCEPLYGINCGLALGYNGSTNNTVPLDQMGPWVQDALDLIEYCNGATNTTWGAVRAANGHPAPFNLKYIEIGNENGGTYYNDRYALFYDAIKSNYPSMNVIACVWGGTPSSRPVEIQDEHYYSSPGTFISYATKYDSYSRSGPKVFVGEYAVTSGYGTLGNLSAALGEAAFMTGMERNPDVVKLASYAPLFANVNGIQWHPDLIYYDNSRVVGTPSYYVQKLFGQNRGDLVLPMSITISNALPRGAIGLGSWNTSVQYSNVVVTSNGVTLYQSDFAGSGTNGWRVFKGTWSTSGALYQQTAIATDCRSTTGDTNWNNITITLKARKVSGNEGFLILFNWRDDNNWTWWNVGGWNNTLGAIEQNVNGSKSLITPQVSSVVQPNQWYDLRIVLTGARVQCYLENALIHDVSYPNSALFGSASYAASTGQVIVKAVNVTGSPIATTLNLNGLASVASQASLVQLASANSAIENSLASPTNIVPFSSVLSNVGANFTLTLPANSLSVLRLNAQPLPPPGKFTGAIIGTPGSWNNSGNTMSNVFDGNLTTYYDAANASGDWAGLDLGFGKVITQLRYCPRSGVGSRMLGGVFQGANNSNFTGAVTLFTITATPAEGTLTSQTITDTNSYRYVRYLGPSNGYCNVAELEFLGNDLPLSGFALWQMQNFGCTNCAQAAPDADADGDGMLNTNEFLAGTSPTNSASAFRIISVEAQGDNMLLTWRTAAGKTNAVQAVSGDYSTNYTDISALILVTGSMTNYFDAGATTNELPRYYRIRLVP